MRGAEIRGVVAFVAVVAAIVVIWTTIENRDTTTAATASTTTTTTTTTVPSTTTTTPEQAAAAVCKRTEDFQLELFFAGEPDEGTTARLALEYWTDMLDLVAPQVRIEIAPVVDYYGDFLIIGAPFEFDTGRIIVEGDKERWEKLITRPANGLEDGRAFVKFICGAELPDQELMSASAFNALEDRLLDND